MVLCLILEIVKAKSIVKKIKQYIHVKETLKHARTKTKQSSFKKKKAETEKKNFKLSF